MPIGLNAEKRPADMIANAVHMMRSTTGEERELMRCASERQ